MRSASLGRLRAELAIVAGTLVGVAALAFFPHVANGGFYSDDWAFAANYHFAPSPRFFNAIEEFRNSSGGGRPLLAVLRSTQLALFGPHPGAQIAFGLLLGIVACLCFFALLRTLGMKAIHAGAIAVLAFLFPWADSIRLWATASINAAAIAFYFLGALVAIRALSLRGRRGVLTHAGAVALYLASVLTYEATGVVACLTGVLYFRRAPRSVVLRRWACDIVVVVAALAWSAQEMRHVRTVPSARQSLAAIPTFVRDDLKLLAWSLVPFHSSSQWLRLLALLVAIAVVLAAVQKARRNDQTELRYWLLVGAVAVMAIAAATVPLLGGYLTPLDSGIFNRGNIFTAFPFAILVYALVVTATRVTGINANAATALGFAMIAVIAIGYLRWLYDDQRTWRSAARAQQVELASIDRKLPHSLPAGSSIVTFGYPGEFMPGVPIFHATWDLAGALQRQRGDSSLQAYPLFENAQPECGQAGFKAVFRNETFGQRQLSYGKLFFLSPQAITQVADRRTCQQALHHFRAGSYLARLAAPVGSS